MDRFSEKDISYLLSLKKKIVSMHDKCKGIGYVADVEPCICMKIFNYIKELYFCRIPSDYWSLSFDSLEIEKPYKRFVGEFIDNIDSAIEQGLGIMFLGERGIGKTSLQCEIGKEAISKRYNVVYVLAQSIVDDRFTEDHLFIERIKKAELILIDELDKISMKADSNIPKQLENLFREILPNRKSVLICTNMDEDEVENKFTIMSLFRRYIKMLNMKGEDYSEKKQKEWMDKLKSNKINFFSETIVTMAKRFYDNRSRADEREYNELF